jgi:flagellar basal-body rod modification protein FlgD
MTIEASLSAQEKADISRYADVFNAKLNEGKGPGKQSLGKDDFLKLLITQLSYQDPTSPMENTEFIAQMAQFSSLEQMTSMSSDFAKLANILAGSEAASALGKSVDIVEGDKVIQGTVDAVSRGGEPKVFVGGTYYEWNKVTGVFVR